MASKKDQKRPRGQKPGAAAAASTGPAAWIRAHALAVTVGLILLATLRIVATYDVYNHTSDELAHIACGMEWLDRGTYQLEPQHPPLARVAAAMGPYLSGVGSQGQSGIFVEGATILYRGNYESNLSRARMGILPFFWIAALVVYFWARRYQGEVEAVLAVFLFTFLPPVLAHAGLATTDMALTAFMGASFLTALIWAEEPTWRHSAAFGLCVGLAVLSKFSALPFVPLSLAAALIWYFVAARPGFSGLASAARSRLLPFGLALAVGALVIWAGYRFSLKGELWAGIQQVINHNRKGHSSYLLGRISDSGSWYFFPLMLLVKTPLPVLALAVFAKLRRTLWLPLLFSASILLFSMTSRINIGVRHVLPVYIGLALLAASGAGNLLERGLPERIPAAAWAKWTLAALLVCVAGTSLFAHPDYLPYFNALAGDEPEKIAVDSDLDWGQDINRLSARLREVGAREVAFDSFVLFQLERRHGFPPVRPIDPRTPSPGWNAVSLTVLKEMRLGLFDKHPEITPWPETVKRQERVGKGILLYYFPPPK
jgi:4-amino-4-deoxy-L-arabinose transferase-like glycosyltransferase